MADPPANEPELRVLLVEDNLADAFRVKEALRDRGLGSFRTTVVGRLGDAVPQLEDSDVVLLDLSLPDGSGIELLDRVRVRGPSLPVVVLSGRRDEETAIQCLQHGAQDVLVKGTVDGGSIARALRCARERKALAEGRDAALARALAAEGDLRTTLAASREGMVVTDTGGLVLYVNPAAEELLGWLPGLVPGGPVNLPLATPGPSEVERRGADGEIRTLEVRISRIVWEESPALLATLHDLTPRKRVERARMELEDRRREADWLGAMGRLAGGVAHGLSDQLTTIHGNASLIRGEKDATDRVRELARQVEEAGWRAADLVAQLLACAGRQMARPATVDLVAALEEIRARASRSVGPGIALRWEVAAGLPRVRIDPGMLGKAVLTLVEHARDAMADGGDLTFQAIVARPRALRRERTAADPRPLVAIAVSDTGPGLGTEARKRLFQPFYTTDVLGIGSGLGLAPVAGIARQAGGSLEVESAPGRGTTIRLLLPGVDDDAPAEVEPEATEEPAPEEDLPRGTEVVLVVEADLPAGDQVRALLQELGYRVLFAPDAGDAVRIATTWAGPLPLLVAERRAAGMDGAVLAGVLRCSRRRLRAILLDSQGGRDAEGLHEKDRLLARPFTRPELAQLVRRTLDAVDGPAKDDGRSLN